MIDPVMQARVERIEARIKLLEDENLVCEKATLNSEYNRLRDASVKMLAALEGMLEWARRVKGPNPGPEVLNAIIAIESAKNVTPKQFLKKYPHSRENTGCLMDIGCSECGNRVNFQIAFTGTAEVYDDGSDDAGDHEWDGDSSCRCSCGAAGVLRDFTIKGLDDLIYQNTP